MTVNEVKEIARSLVMGKAKQIFTKPVEGIEESNMELARISSGKYPIQIKGGSIANVLPFMQGLKLLGIAGEGNKNQAVLNAYNRVKTQQEAPQDREILNKQALDQLINMAGTTSNVGKSRLLDEQYLAMKKAIGEMPLNDLVKGSTLNTPTYNQFAGMDKVQREAIKKLLKMKNIELNYAPPLPGFVISAKVPKKFVEGVNGTRYYQP